MAKKVSGPPPARNRSRKKSAPKWPLYAGGIMGLFIVSFLVGMYGLPRVNPAANGGTEIPVVPSAPVPSSGDRVKVTELPYSTRRTRTEAPERRREAKKDARESKPAEAPTPPSPPAVSGAIPLPTPRKKPAPAPAAETGTAHDGSGGEETPDEAPAPSNYRVQAGSFQDEENARRLADRLASSGYQPSVTTSKNSEGTTYRVQVGPFAEKKEAEDAVRDLGSQGISARVNDE